MPQACIGGALPSSSLFEHLLNYITIIYICRIPSLYALKFTIFLSFFLSSLRAPFSSIHRSSKRSNAIDVSRTRMRSRSARYQHTLALKIYNMRHVYHRLLALITLTAHFAKKYLYLVNECLRLLG